MLVDASKQMPIALTSQQTGLVYDLGRRLAAELNEPVRFLARPTRRIELALLEREGDLLCFFSPTWLSQPDRFAWSDTLITDREIIVSSMKAPIHPTLDQLFGDVIGTVNGYSYPSLQSYFDSGKIRFDVAPNNESNMKKLGLRFNFAVINESKYDYLMRTRPPGKPPRYKYLSLTTTALRCAFAPPESKSQRALRDTVNRLVAKGVFRDLRAAYR